MRINGELRVERQREFPAVCGCLKETPLRGSQGAVDFLMATYWQTVYTILFLAEERENISTIHISAY
jgi:hypothetical protein